MWLCILNNKGKCEFHVTMAAQLRLTTPSDLQDCDVGAGI